MKSCQFGFASVEVTPPPGIRLYCLENESRSSENIQDPLLATSFCIQDAIGGLAIIISVDIIWLSPTICQRVQRRLSTQLCISPESVFVCATHTHASPQVLEKSRNFAQPDFNYIVLLVDAMVDSAMRAYTSMCPGTLHIATVNCPVAVYRRKAIPDTNALKGFRWKRFIANRPVPGHTIDDLLTVLRIDDLTGTPRAMMLNLACHPTLFRKNAVSADYPGQIRLLLRERFGFSFETIFLQGYSGNLKPAIYRIPPFRFQYPIQSIYSLLFDRLHFNKTLNSNEIKAFANRILHFMDQAKFHEIQLGRFSASQISVELPIATLSEKVSMGVHVLKLGPELSLIGLEGEIFMEYALWLRSKFSGALPVSFCGGAVGYIPDEVSLELGGYEIDRSLDDFGLPGKFASGIEKLVKTGIIDALNVADDKCQIGLSL